MGTRILDQGDTTPSLVLRSSRLSIEKGPDAGILVSKQGSVLLSDPGIARSALREVRTRTGVVKGKVRYLSPEQATCSSVDPRTDLYAVGLLLFELLTGESFVQGESEPELLRASEAPAFRAPSASRELDRRLDGIVELALARFPEERYQSASAFLSALEEVLVDAHHDVESPSLESMVEEVLEAKATHRDDVPLVALEDVQERREAACTMRLASAVGSRSAPRQRNVLPWILLAVTIIGGGIAAWLWQGPDDGDGRRTMLTDAGPARQVDAVPDEFLLDTDLGAVDPSFDEPNAAEAGESPSRERDSGVSKSPPAIVVGKSRPTAVTAKTGKTGVEAQGAQGVKRQTDAGSTSETTAQRAALKGRLLALRSGLGQRGILVEDLPAAQREAVASSQRRLAGADDSQLDEVAASVAQLERALPGLQVDAEFVRRKLDRVGARIRQAKNRGVETSRFEDLVSIALQGFADGRYDATNRRLNEIIRLLGRAESQQ